MSKKLFTRHSLGNRPEEEVYCSATDEDILAQPCVVEALVQAAAKAHEDGYKLGRASAFLESVKAIAAAEKAARTDALSSPWRPS